MQEITQTQQQCLVKGHPNDAPQPAATVTLLAHLADDVRFLELSYPKTQGSCDSKVDNATLDVFGLTSPCNTFGLSVVNCPLFPSSLVSDV